MTYYAEIHSSRDEKNIPYLFPIQFVVGTGFRTVSFLVLYFSELIKNARRLET